MHVFDNQVSAFVDREFPNEQHPRSLQLIMKDHGELVVRGRLAKASRNSRLHPLQPV